MLLPPPQPEPAGEKEPLKSGRAFVGQDERSNKSHVQQRAPLSSTHPMTWLRGSAPSGERGIGVTDLPLWSSI